MDKLNYKILGTGSKGNCVIIENVMIDCAVSWKKMKESLYDIDVLLISHLHSDHFRKSTYERIRKEFPNIVCCMNVSTISYTNQDFDVIIKDYVPIEVAGLTITPFPLLHTVENHGFIWEFNGQRIVYATDTSSMEYCPTEDKFDYIFLESNHDEKKLKKAYRRSKDYGFNTYAASKAHLSTQKSKAFYLINRKSKESEWIELHQSSRFY